MDASRLVFVSDKNAKPRRKVAVPIPDGYTWSSFCQQIETKLKLKGIGSIILATSGEHITTLDELQDIDELYVEEAEAKPALPNGMHSSSERDDSGAGPSSSAGLANGLSHGSDGVTPVSRAQQRTNTSAMEIEDKQDPEQKYVKRTGGVRRSLQRVLPSLFSPRLPVTTKDIQDDSRVRSKKKRKRTSFFAPRNLIKLFGLLIFISGLLYVYSLMVPKLEKT